MWTSLVGRITNNFIKQEVALSMFNNFNVDSRTLISLKVLTRYEIGTI